MACFLQFHIVLYYVAALTKPIYIEGVAGVAGGCVVAYVVVPVVAEAGAGGHGLGGGGAHIGQLEVLQVAVGFYVKADAKLITYVQFGIGLDLFQAVAVPGVDYAPDGAVQGNAVVVGLYFVKGLGK